MDDLPAQVWFCDFEFSSASEGECPVPICCVAREWHTGQTFRLWENELAACPYDTGPDSLLVSHGAVAELVCHLVLNWPLPANVFCTYAEYRAYINTSPIKDEAPPPASLIDACANFEISSPVDKIIKKRIAGSLCPWRSMGAGRGRGSSELLRRRHRSTSSTLRETSTFHRSCACLATREILQGRCPHGGDRDPVQCSKI
jgi:hypothetical protein